MEAGVKKERHDVRRVFLFLLQNIVEKQKRHPNRDTVPVVRCKGFEPLTFWFVAKHSIQLSYSRMSLRGLYLSCSLTA